MHLYIGRCLCLHVFETNTRGFGYKRTTNSFIFSLLFCPFFFLIHEARANLKVRAMTLNTGIAVFLLKEILLSEIMQDLVELYKPLAENPWRRMKGSSFS